jgi:hypothetical protein
MTGESSCSGDSHESLKKSAGPGNLRNNWTLAPKIKNRRNGSFRQFSWEEREMALLSVGSRGSDVVTLQKELNKQLYPKPNLSEDGIFGPKTRDAVIAFQKFSGITVDGIVGPETRAALGIPETGGGFTHRVRLHFRSISLTDVPFNTILSNTQLVYAQYGIKVEYASGMSLMLTAAESRRLEQLDGSCTWKINSGEYAELLQKGGSVPSNEISVFFVNRFSEAINGCGGHMKNRPACIVAKAGTKWCTAHEVCHVLLTSSFSPVHITDTKNLMHPVDITRSATPKLTPAQVTQIKASPMCVPI